MIDKISAGLGLVVCVVLLLRMAAGPARAARFDRIGRQGLDGLRRRLAGFRRGAAAQKPVDAAAARREAEQLIDRARRARSEADHDGNVIRPRAFDPSKKKPPLH